MIASELLTLNTSNTGSTLTRPTLNVRETLKSSCVIRSTNVARAGSRYMIKEGWPNTPVGIMIWFAGHGDGQSAGYRVIPRVTFIVRVLVGLLLLCSATLKSI